MAERLQCHSIISDSWCLIEKDFSVNCERPQFLSGSDKKAFNKLLTGFAVER